MKMRTIDADALRDEVDSTLNWNTNNEYNMYSDVMDMIDDAPTIDVQPVKHGRCVIDNEGYERCSVCNEHETGMRYFTFCPRCGAKLDGDTK
jgi:hypothetical protein